MLVKLDGTVFVVLIFVANTLLGTAA
jgi:hypothetical protein